MSLYDKASLIFSGAAGAGNEEVAYNIKPVEKLKVDELITNNKLLTSDGWVFSDSNITVASGKIVFNNAAQYATARWDTDVFEEGKTYRVSFRVEDFKGGASNSKLLAQQANNTQINTQIDRDGNYSFYYTPGAPDGTTHQNKFQLKTVTTSVEAKVSDFSIKEVEQEAKDLSFTRASDLTATYEGADGLIKKTRENLVEYSNDFIKWDDAIVDGVANSFYGYTVTSGKSGYDGSNNATLVEKTGSQNSYIYTDINTVSHNGVFTYSIYARDGGDDNSSIHIYIGDSSNKGNLRVNLNTGAVLGGNNVLNTVEAITGSPGDTDRWYRVSFTNDANLNDKPRIQVRDNTGGQNTNAKAFVQNAQFEVGMVATPYIDRTGAAYSTAGIREDEPRYDYSLDNDAPPALLYEPERQNELPHSEYLDSFVKNTGITLTTNTTDTKSPEGLYNATKVVSTNSSGGFYKSGLNITADTVNSIYLKGAAGGEFCRLKDPGGYGGFINITLTTDWVRYELKSTYSGNAGEQHQGLYVDDIASGSTIYAWGAQKEKGSCVTSYIPTYGSAGTREADVIPQYTPSKTNLDKYTFFAHSHSDRVASDNRAPRLKGDGNSALMGIFVNGAGKKQFFLYDNENNSTLSKATFGSFEAGDDTKYAFVVDNIALEAKLFIDGVLRETISLTERVDAKIISVGNSDGNPDRIKSIMYFPEALENGDVVSLTT